MATPSLNPTVAHDFEVGARRLAETACDACRDLLPPSQAALLRSDQLLTETPRAPIDPLVVAVASLAPACHAAGRAVSASGAGRAVDLASEAIVEATLAGIELLGETDHDEGDLCRFVHAVAHASHLAADAAEGSASLPGHSGSHRDTAVPGHWRSWLTETTLAVERARRDQTLSRQCIEAAAAARDAAAHALRTFDASQQRSSSVPSARRMLRIMVAASISAAGVPLATVS